MILLVFIGVSIFGCIAWQVFLFIAENRGDSDRRGVKGTKTYNNTNNNNNSKGGTKIHGGYSKKVVGGGGGVKKGCGLDYGKNKIKKLEMNKKNRGSGFGGMV